MRFVRTLQRFARERRGSVGMMVGMTIPVIATSVMASVEFNSVVAAKTKMQNRADSAALYAANNKDLLDSSNELQNSTRQLVLDAVKASGIDVKNVVTNYTYDESRDRIVGEVTFSPNAKFLGSFFLPETVTVVTEAAPLKPKKVEVSLVLDLSGSMNWSPTSDASVEAAVGSRRVDALRDGVNTLIDELDGEETVEAKYTIVPYASSVDLTDLAVNAPVGVPAYYENAAGGNLPTVCARQDFGNSVPAACLGTGNNNTNDPNGSSQTGLWASERFASRDANSFTLSLNTPSSSRIPVVTQGARFDACHWSYVNTFGSQCIEAAKNIHGIYYVEKDYFNTRSGVLSLTSNAQEARDYLNSLEAKGGTAGHLGTIWGLYALTPGWAPVFSPPAGAPEAFDDEETHKIMVVMTDGDFTSTQNTGMNNDDAYTYFQAACNLAREQGIEIYTVGLRASTNTDTQLTQCAGSSARYYSVDNRGALIRAFKKISDSATQVRLSS